MCIFRKLDEIKLIFHEKDVFLYFIFVQNNMYAWEGRVFQKKSNKQLQLVSHALKLFNNKNKSQAPITKEI